MGIVRDIRLKQRDLITDLCDSAFGGMVAFCIIIGDTIRKLHHGLTTAGDLTAKLMLVTAHVMTYSFPRLSGMPFLWLLTDRRAIIVMCVLGISYPLSLYRDIAKVGA